MLSKRILQVKPTYFAVLATGLYVLTCVLNIQIPIRKISVQGTANCVLQYVCYFYVRQVQTIALYSMEMNVLH